MAFEHVIDACTLQRGPAMHSCLIPSHSPHSPVAAASANRDESLEFSSVEMAAKSAWRSVLYFAGGILLGAARARAYSDYDFTPRNYSGVGNNIEFPAWGSVGTTQVRDQEEKGCV